MVFEEIKLGWNGQTYVCPPNKVWLMMQHLESKGVDIIGITQNGGVTQKCTALSECLAFLGMKNPPSGEQVYESLFSSDENNIQQVMVALQLMTVPPSVRKRALEITPEEAEKEVSELKKKPKKVKGKAS